MFDHWLRLLKDRWFTPLARALGPGVSPHLVTWLAAVAGLACAMTASQGMRGVSAALWALNRVLDGLDGTLARMHGRQTDLGGYLDIVLDFVVYAAVPLGVVAGTGPALLWPALWLLAAFFVNAASWMYLAAIMERRAIGAAARGEVTTITMPPGVVAGAETVVLYLVFLLAPRSRRLGFLLMAAFVGVNVAQRLWWARRNLS